MSRPYYGCGLPYVSGKDLGGKLIVIEGTDGVGRSTQMGLLQQWIELQGFPVVTTGWTRSNLVAKSIEAAKSGNMLNHLTYTLLYATDFADRLENVILPALRSGFVVLCDRYIYTAIARSGVRGLDKDYLRTLFGIALVPDIVLYLRVDIETLIPRVIEANGLNYWESGMDMHLDRDYFESFRKYQMLLIHEFDLMAKQYGFEAVDASVSVEAIQERIREKVGPILR
ncbi:MAG: dTMP kinase [Planctomycetes bacterium]|nr:dTMP kinase [Planctomycetota bacterium]